MAVEVRDGILDSTTLGSIGLLFAESVEFTSEEEFTEKLGTLKEAYAPSTVKFADKAALEEGVEVPEDKPARRSSGDALIDAAANAISKSVIK